MKRTLLAWVGKVYQTPDATRHCGVVREADTHQLRFPKIVPVQSIIPGLGADHGPWDFSSGRVHSQRVLQIQGAAAL